MSIFKKSEDEENTESELISENDSVLPCGEDVGSEEESALSDDEKGDPVPYLHESDSKAMDALKSVSGFTSLLKSFMSGWNERQFRVQNMSSNLRLGEQQLPKYYNMLPPICEKLGIEVPELYLTLDVVPDSWTYGDEKPFITITSGLIETLPDELIPTVLAHECGHIACRHTLLTTMGAIMFNNPLNKVGGLGALFSIPLQVGFSYWMRCSDLSADRAAAICDGGAEGVIELCMRYAGCDKDIPASANKRLFMEQALEYKEMVSSSKWDKTTELWVASTINHPLNAVRAYECDEWVKTEQFKELTLL